jgi:hypothetical protein
MIAGSLFVAPAHAGSPEAFYGHYEGSGTSRDPNVTFFELTQRDLDVRIGPDGAGFFVEWTTVIRDSVDAEVRRREARVAFDPSDRPGIYLARDAANAQGMAWASINDRTMTVRSLRILKNGSYAVQTYHRTITDDEMFLHFISDEDGQTIRMVTARLKKTSE